MEKQQVYDIMEVCLLAGKIMLQSGAETYRVEDTMSRMAYAFGVKEVHSYVTPTGIIFTIESSVEPTKTKLVRITERTTDLHKVTLVNSVSRKISSGQLSVTEALAQLKTLDESKLTYSTTMQIVAAAIASGCFLIMFNGAWVDFLPAFFTGGVGLWSVMFFHRVVPIKFFSEFLGAMIIGFLSLLFIKIGWGHNLDKIIIGSVMPLVPGLLLTNGVRDLMAGHLVSGMSKGAEAVLTAFAIGSGIAVVLSLM